ncbi:hypothetical protein FKP32DRAFT_749624 [Trametes sanguinea]|nr:hypothetical protein FKP32DRAFT_749624 [Trametes sanguinea]
MSPRRCRLAARGPFAVARSRSRARAGARQSPPAAFSARGLHTRLHAAVVAIDARSSPHSFVSHLAPPASSYLSASLRASPFQQRSRSEALSRKRDRYPQIADMCIIDSLRHIHGAILHLAASLQLAQTGLAGHHAASSNLP